MSDAAHANKAPPAGPRWDPLRNWPGWARNLLRVSGWAIGLAVSAAVTLVTLVAIALSVAYPNLPDIAGLSDYRPKLPLRVISADGVLLGEFGEERRQFTPIGRIPKVMKDAVLAIEDAHFYEHGGVDYKGVLRASIASLSEFKSQGASTITMQLARNFYLSTEKTFTRKIYEILLALKIESQLSKEQILEVYMNQIYLGQRAYGFAAASEVYFGKPLHDITVAEAAMLAGLCGRRRRTTPSPTRAAPTRGSSTSSIAWSPTATSPRSRPRLHGSRHCAIAPRSRQRRTPSTWPKPCAS